MSVEISARMARCCRYGAIQDVAHTNLCPTICIYRTLFSKSDSLPCGRTTPSRGGTTHKKNPAAPELQTGKIRIDRLLPFQRQRHLCQGTVPKPGMGAETRPSSDARNTLR